MLKWILYDNRMKTKGTIMDDIQYIVDDNGVKRAVIIDLSKFGDLWEDFYDTMTARQRSGEPRESISTVRKHLTRAGKLNG